MNKITTLEKAVERVPDGAVLLVGGFYGIGMPHNVIDELIRQSKKDLTLVSVEACSPGYGIAKLIEQKRVKKLITTWIGNLALTIHQQVSDGSLELELNPQGTLIERIRAGGYGLGGVLTPTGLGTDIEEQGYGVRMNLNGKDWLYHTPIHADVAIVEAYAADSIGNLQFRGTQRNFSETMCAGADLVIASIMTPIVEKGAIEPNAIHVPSLFVDLLIQGTNEQVEERR